MAIILRTAYFFNPFCIKQVPINCSKVNPMEQKYFVLANNVFSDGCGGYLTIGTEITLADTIGKNSEDWGLLLHVAGGGEDYWITGTAEEFRTDCECIKDPDCACGDAFQITRNFSLTFDGGAGTGAIGSITMPTIEDIPAGWFLSNGWVEVETTLVGVGAKITMGIATDAPTNIYNNFGINVINANAPIIYD